MITKITKERLKKRNRSEESFANSSERTVSLIPTLMRRPRPLKPVDDLFDQEATFSYRQAADSARYFEDLRDRAIRIGRAVSPGD